MFRKSALLVIVALVGVASASNKCQLQSQVPSSSHPEFRAYVQVDGSYLPLKYRSHFSHHDQLTHGVFRGKAAVITDCAQVRVSIVATYNQKIYTMESMDFAADSNKQSCVLGPAKVEENGVKRYNCMNADEKVIATLVIEHLSFTDRAICQMNPTEVCKFDWVEANHN